MDYLDSDDEATVFTTHPNVQYSRNYYVMSKVKPTCLFVPHPNTTMTRIPQFQSCLGCKYESLKESVGCKCDNKPKKSVCKKSSKTSCPPPKSPCAPPLKTSCSTTQTCCMPPVKEQASNQCHSDPPCKKTTCDPPVEEKPKTNCNAEPPIKKSMSKISFCNEAPKTNEDCESDEEKPKHCFDNSKSGSFKPSCCASCGKTVDIKPNCAAKKPKPLTKCDSIMKPKKSPSKMKTGGCEGRIKYV